MSKKPRRHTVVEFVERTKDPDTHRLIKYDEIRINGQPVTVKAGSIKLAIAEKPNADVCELSLTLLLDEFHIRPATP